MLLGEPEYLRMHHDAMAAVHRSLRSDWPGVYINAHMRTRNVREASSSCHTDMRSR